MNVYKFSIKSPHGPGTETWRIEAESAADALTIVKWKLENRDELASRILGFAADPALRDDVCDCVASDKCPFGKIGGRKRCTIAELRNALNDAYSK